MTDARRVELPEGWMWLDGWRVYAARRNGIGLMAQYDEAAQYGSWWSPQRKALVAHCRAKTLGDLLRTADRWASRQTAETLDKDEEEAP